MTEHLWPLKRLKASNEDDLKKQYRQLYVETYVRTGDGKEIEIYDWNGRRVKFSYHIFDHAFSESKNYRSSYGVHDISFSEKRARHILWIKEVLKATQGTIEVRSQIRKDSRGRNKKRRTLIVVEEKYVVVLEENEKVEEKGFIFISAFPADRGYVENIRRNSAFLEIKKPQS